MNPGGDVTTFQAIVLGIVQGLGEFLPISSSAHLVVTPWLLGWPDPGLAFDVALHLGTLAAVLYAFAGDWVRIITAAFKGFVQGRPFEGDGRLLWLLAMASIPGAVAGLALEEYADTTFRSPLLIAFTMAVVGTILLIADRHAARIVAPEGATHEARNVTVRDALLIGCAQAVAIVPGVSRSGSTISMALFLGYRREEAARFSFLLATPITLGAALHKVPALIGAGSASLVLLGIVVSGIVGLLAIRILLAYVRTRDYRPFVYYRWAFAAMLVIVYLVRQARVGQHLRMRPVLTAAQMREADRRTIEEIGLSGAVLMESAGAAVARVVRARHPGLRRPLILCGKGNNGGDGFVVARRLLDLAPSVFLFGSRQDVRGEARLHMGALERSGGVLVEVVDDQGWARVRAAAADADLAVDALLGTGLHQAPTGAAADAIALLRTLRRDRGTIVVAVDIPSGVPSDTGELEWDAVEADLTVTFAAPKYGHVLPPACEHVGALVVADIGIAAAVIAQTAPSLWLAELSDVAKAYPPREGRAHKGTFGHVLVAAGAVGKTGAALLSATGALVSGAGLVTVATPAPALPLVAQGRPELMTEPLPVTSSGVLDREAAARAVALARTRDALVIGPGLGQEPAVRDFVRDVLRAYTGPIVVDADGLNALAAADRVPRATDALRRTAPIVVTPHPGEMARLVGVPTAEVQRRRLETARAFAVETGAVVVLKGQRTIVARPDGAACVNPTGNPGMATGGTGDVLSGIIGALLARGLDGWTAAVAGVYLHGAAGDDAALRRGQESLVASDLLDSIPEVLRRVRPATPGPAAIEEDAHS